MGNGAPRFFFVKNEKELAEVNYSSDPQAGARDALCQNKEGMSGKKKKESN